MGRASRPAPLKTAGLGGGGVSGIRSSGLPPRSIRGEWGGRELRTSVRSFRGVLGWNVLALGHEHGFGEFWLGRGWLGECAVGE
jgi:hypothetical protein